MAEKLIDIVNSVTQGAAWFDPKVAQYVLKAATGANDISNTVSNKEELTGSNQQNTEANLTSREKQVLSLIVEGLSNTEISKKLELSVNTIKVHVCNILQKLSVSDRTQAAIKAIKDNII